MKSKRLQKVVNKFLFPEDSSVDKESDKLNENTKDKTDQGMGKGKNQKKVKGKAVDESNDKAADNGEELVVKTIDKSSGKQARGKGTRGRGRGRKQVDKEEVKDETEADEDVEQKGSRGKQGQTTRGRGRGRRQGTQRSEGNEFEKEIAEDNTTSDSESDSDSSCSESSHSDSNDDDSVCENSLSVAEILGLKFGKTDFPEGTTPYSDELPSTSGVKPQRVFESGLDVKELMKLESGDKDKDSEEQSIFKDSEVEEDDAVLEMEAEDENFDAAISEYYKNAGGFIRENEESSMSSDDIQSFRNVHRKADKIGDQVDNQRKDLDSDKKSQYFDDKILSSMEKSKETGRSSRRKTEKQAGGDFDNTVEIENIESEENKKPIIQKIRSNKQIGDAGMTANKNNKRKGKETNTAVSKEATTDLPKDNRDESNTTENTVKSVGRHKTKSSNKKKGGREKSNSIDVSQQDTTKQDVKKEEKNLQNRKECVDSKSENERLQPENENTTTAAKVKTELESKKKDIKVKSEKSKVKEETVDNLQDLASSTEPIKKIVAGVPWADQSKKGRRGRSGGVGTTGGIKRNLQPVEKLEKRSKVARTSRNPVGCVNLSESDSDSS